MNSNDIACPRCFTTKYRNPQLKLLVNICGHSLCENCIELMFANGFAKCFQCPTPLKRARYKEQLFQDAQVEKDVQVRRDILRRFTKNQESFPSLRAYNDYLEKVETVIYNLANDIDPDETNKLLEELRRPDACMGQNKKDKQVKEVPYHHKPIKFDYDGPKIPKINERYYKATRPFSVREVAGGFTADLAINRALADAFMNLFSQFSRPAASN